MKYLALAAALTLLAPLAPAADAPASAPAAAPTRSDVLAAKILEASNPKAVIGQNFEAGLKPFLDRMRQQGMPSDLVDSIHDEAGKFFAENFKWEDLRPQFVKLYTTSFSEQELAQIAAFYDSPVGVKAAALVPKLSQEGMAIGMARVQNKMPELQQRIGAIVDAYQKKAAAAAAAAAAAPAPAAQSPAAGK